MRLLGLSDNLIAVRIKSPYVERSIYFVSPHVILLHNIIQQLILRKTPVAPEQKGDSRMIRLEERRLLVIPMRLIDARLERVIRILFPVCRHRIPFR